MILKRYTKPLYHRRCRRVKNTIGERDLEPMIRFVYAPVTLSFGGKR